MMIILIDRVKSRSIFHIMEGGQPFSDVEQGSQRTEPPPEILPGSFILIILHPITPFILHIAGVAGKSRRRAA